LAVNIKNIVSPLNRGGTLSLAITDTYRLLVNTPDFNNMPMAASFYNTSYAADDFSGLYVPDTDDEWQMTPAGVTSQANSEILIALEGTQASTQPYRLLLSYVIEYDPTASLRQLVNIARPEVAPATLSCIQMILKYYSSILVQAPATRGEFIRSLRTSYPDFCSLEYVSQLLSAIFEPTSISRKMISAPSSTSDMARSSAMSGISKHLNSNLRSRRTVTPETHVASQYEHQRDHEDTSNLSSKTHRSQSPLPGKTSDDLCPVIEDSDDELITSCHSKTPSNYYSVISTIKQAAENIELETILSNNQLVITDQNFQFVLHFQPVPCNIPSFNSILKPSTWTATLSQYMLTFSDFTNCAIRTSDIISYTDYTIKAIVLDTFVYEANCGQLLSCTELRNSQSSVKSPNHNLPKRA